ncbi:ABC transporter ATP-binding protein [Marinovum sp. 2_MG-2023]|uniref:ABC transporter ATP-binding protein n=1 Tax=unclassified Marinovum TaxID=2647166 RepID=UPI0026E20F68|nr:MULTISPECIES: ABC transporter ATP-binding protein [unclassified Marinovum]MDO6728961.1 ABC transporter ATP-binding protein [Marinovum sp. 2_MG-2023]MDO6779412.1 ABC transporter ATP-binding protein [Marinovum sp. 1_MG-2023]
MQELLSIKDLRVEFDLGRATLNAVNGVNLSLNAGESFGIVGESGSGKSVTAQAIMRIVPNPGNIVNGSIMLNAPGGAEQGSDGGVDLARINTRGGLIRKIRGGRIAMIFQEPMTSLSPVHRIGDQIVEAVMLHRTRDKAEARDIALHYLERMQITNPQQRFREYPFNLSGGMRQRVMIAMGLACDPDLLIADEPTTALDVTVQSQILELLEGLREEMGMSILYITHDLGVVAEVTQRIAVMYLGRIVETGTTRQVLKNPCHPYTKGLIDSFPKLSGARQERLQAIPGNVPVPIGLPWQCGFRSRCPVAIDGKCDTSVPAMTPVEDGHMVRCFHNSDTKEPPLPQAPAPRARRSLFSGGRT